MSGSFSSNMIRRPLGLEADHGPAGRRHEGRAGRAVAGDQLLDLGSGLLDRNGRAFGECHKIRFSDASMAGVHAFDLLRHASLVRDQAPLSAVLVGFHGRPVMSQMTIGPSRRQEVPIDGFFFGDVVHDDERLFADEELEFLHHHLSEL
jgi:hypothetical protein